MPKVIPSDFDRLPRAKRVALLKEILGDKVTTKAGSKDAVNAVKRMFHMPKYGITPSVLKRGMATFGLPLKDADVNDLFAALDTDRTGCILIDDFLKKIQPAEYSGVLWNVARDRADEDKLRRARGTYKPVAETLPPSLGDIKWSTDKIIRKLREKVEQRARCPGLSQNREAYAMFGAPKRGITPAAFKSTMSRMGFVLSETQLAEVFSRLDSDGSGVLTFADFVGGVLSDEYSGKTWDAARNEQMAVTKRTSKREDRAVRDLPSSMGPTREEMGLDFVEAQLRDKVAAKSRSVGAFREVFRLFDHSGSTIDRVTFVRTCRRLGVAGTDKDLKRLFNKYDTDGAGLLDLKEFSKMVTPSDYVEKPWQVKRDEEDEEKLWRKKVEGYEPTLRRIPRALETADSMTVGEVEDAIIERVNQRAKEPAAQFREAYRLLGAPEDGVTLPMLEERLARMGLVLKPGDLKAMFDLYDKDKSGRITYQELATRLFRKGDGSSMWNIKRDAEIAKRKAAMRELALKDAPHNQPRFRGGAGSGIPFSSRTDMTTERSWGTHTTHTAGRSSYGRSTGRSTTARTAVSGVSGMSGLRSRVSSRSHTAIRTGPDMGIVGASAYSSRSSRRLKSPLTSSARSLLSK